MEKRVLRVADDTWKLDRMRRLETEQNERERLLVSLKNSSLPIVQPSLTRAKEAKCEKCKVEETLFIKADDWFMEPVDALMLNEKLFDGWFDWMKFIVFGKPVLPVSMTSLAIHPAHIKMIHRLSKSKPAVPLVFTVHTRTPEVDVLIINYALRVNGIKAAVLDVHNMIQKNPYVEIISDVSQIRPRLNENENLLLLLDGDEEDSLTRVLFGCSFGASKIIFLLPVSINSERNVQSGSPLNSSTDLGIVKINFHEPYTIDDLLKESILNVAQEQVMTISKHLLYDVTRKRPVMSTNVVAFLLLTEFRDGALVKDLAGRLDAFRNNNHSIDFAFDGDAEDVVEHAIEILKELVKAQGDIITPNVSNIVELSSYAEVLVPHFALQSILIVSAQSLKRAENFVDFNILITTATDLCGLLENQIKFAKPCEDLSSQLSRAFDRCCIEGFLHKPVVAALTVNEQRAQRIARQYESENEDSDDEGYQSRNTNNEVTFNVALSKEIEALKNVVIPILDCHLTVACCLKKIIGPNYFPVHKIVQRSVEMMREELEDGNCKYWESCSKTWIENSLKSFELWGIIEVRQSMINIHPKHNNKKSIKHIIQQTERFF